MTLLTHMPGIIDYFLFFSIYIAIICLALTVVSTLIVLMVKKGEYTPKKYLILGSKIFGISFIILEILVFAFFMFIG